MIKIVKELHLDDLIIIITIIFKYILWLEQIWIIEKANIYSFIITNRYLNKARITNEAASIVVLPLFKFINGTSCMIDIG